jgi:AcrR family transcriptional regulator
MTSTDTTRRAARGVERALAAKREKYQDEFDRLLAAALRVIRAGGTVEPRVSDILAEAGLSTGAFYRHFPAKDDLLLALVEQAGENTRSFLRHQLSAERDPRRRIAAWIEAMFGLLGNDEHVAMNRPFLLAHPRLMERFPDEIDAMVSLLVQPLADAMRDARTAQDAPAGNPERDARLVHHQVFSILMDRAATRTVTDPREVQAVVDYTLRAVLSEPVALPRPRRR